MARVLSSALGRFASQYRLQKIGCKVEIPGISRMNISPRMRLDDVVKRITDLPFEGTDCALPMMWAARNSAVH